MKGVNVIEPVIQHSWDISESQAIILQKELALKVIKEDQLKHVNYIAGVDVAYSKNNDRLVAAVIILDATTQNLIESSVVEDIPSFPYIPGLFSFRELPPVIKAFSKISVTPDLIVCDGQGVAHPRRFGLASHLGVLLNTPTIGCGKTKLLGDYEDPGIKRGDYSTLLDNNDEIGIVLRTQNNVKPIYVSIGHRISLPTACKWILQLAPRFRLPETTRQADQLVNRSLAFLEKDDKR
ncbi:deoxyribonuclease V [Paenibacillus sp. SYP-B4298]|uniref:deoxyribonuclease V n=1 Tax=Paenibacillus sp. SYP-B4298 TaxID=2996034 RepID=UPI0022DE07CA|nr:deoxyribonuclease V [Paenibacillus sp. SYP-B4298]